MTDHVEPPPDDDLTKMIQEKANKEETKKRYRPKDKKPDVRAPDPEVFRQLGVNASTERAIADRFLDAYRHLFVNGDGTLYFYLNKLGRWSSDNINEQIKALCHHLSDDDYADMERLRAEQTQLTAEGHDTTQHAERIARLSRAIARCETFRTMSSTASYLQARLKAVGTLAEQTMNPGKDILACANGVVELRTGELRFPRPTDYITHNTRTDFKDDLETEWWDKVVLDICDGQHRIAEFLQVWFGYCATGAIREQCMVIMWGGGNNGKNLLVDAVAKALGDYSRSMPQGAMELADRNATGMDNNQAYMTAKLDGVRMAYISETGEKGTLKESWIKAMTGDAKITGRAPHQDFYEFTPTHKFTVGTNHKPIIRGTDDGVWRRIHLVHMAVKFGSESQVINDIAQQIADKGLLERATSEEGREVVLRWVVGGAIKYFKHGLDIFVPPEVAASTMLYRKESDVLGMFLADVSEWVSKAEVERVQKLEKDKAASAQFGRMTMEEKLRISKVDLYGVYRQWAIENGHRVMSQQTFSIRIVQTKRMWGETDDEEKSMHDLDTGRLGKLHFYRYIRLDDNGRRLLNVARSTRVKPENQSADDDDFDD